MKIRRFIVALALVASAATRASAAGVYNDGEANPLRLVAFAIAPVGYLAEWLITRPIFRVVSQDDMAPVFSYTPQAGFDYETYQEGLSTGVTFEDPHGMD
jgi:hypothetical protein